VGAGVEVLAQIEDGTSIQVVAVRQDNLLATSFHPEIVEDLRIHKYFLEMVKSA
jgi:5'-phosphate synthase pdxT subunit